MAVLKVWDGSKWVVVQGGVTPPGGNAGEIQFNDAGVFGGITDGADGQLLATDGEGGYSFLTPVRTDYYCYHDLREAGEVAILIAPWTTDSVVAFGGQPDVPRSLAILVVAGLMQTCTGNVEVVGINADGAVISENFDINIQFPGQQEEETVNAFRGVTRVNVTNASGDGTLYVSIEDRIGVSNIPISIDTDVFALNLNGVDIDPTDYTINTTYGTIDMDDVADIVTGDHLEIWCRNGL